MTSQPPIIQIHIPPSLAHLAIPLSTFLSRNAQYTNLVVSGFIFAPSSSSTTTKASPPPASASSPSPLRLLIVQRAPTERSFRNQWEVPGGSCDVSDPTILHSLARETFEETGLHLTRFRRQIGGGEEFVTGYGARLKRWFKLSFEIEVAEVDPSGSYGGAFGKHNHVAAEKGKGSDGVEVVDGVGAFDNMNGVSVTLDPAEHQAYAWVSEEDIKADVYDITTAKAKDLMLEAFALRRADVEASKTVLAPAASAMPAKIGSSG